jgi:molybdate/tungstate transport system substrate-binding protein
MMSPPKAGGSLLLAREISQGDPVSVFIAVSRSAVQPAYLGNQSSGWAIAFASDQMVLAYSNATLQSSAAGIVLDDYGTAIANNSTQVWTNFYYALTSGSTNVGFGDPNADPAGYRGWIVLQAAGKVYASTNFFVNRMIVNNGNITGASAADLIAPLEAGQVQFLFIYRSAAISHHLHYMQLADAVNLGNPAYSSFYSQFSYKSAKGKQKGGLIALYITVPTDSTDTANSLQFVVFVVKNYQSILSTFGLIPMTPAKLYNSTTVPQPIQALVSQGYL